jgi:hypothetical protein
MTIAKHTLTIFNKSVTVNPPFGSTDVWNRTVIKFGQWENNTDRNFDGNGITSIGKHIDIIIPKKVDTGGKGFLKEIDWNKLPADQKPTKWTLRAEDYIFFGEVPELTTAYTITNARADYRYCLIKAISDYTDQPVLPHWELAGI